MPFINTAGAPGSEASCGNELHDQPLPGGYLEMESRARKRVKKGWRNLRCPDCNLYGWRPPGWSSPKPPIPSSHWAGGNLATQRRTKRLRNG